MCHHAGATAAVACVYEQNVECADSDDESVSEPEPREFAGPWLLNTETGWSRRVVQRQGAAGAWRADLLQGRAGPNPDSPANSSHCFHPASCFCRVGATRSKNKKHKFSPEICGMGRRTDSAWQGPIFGPLQKGHVFQKGPKSGPSWN